MEKTLNTPKTVRTSAGLRDALFDELDELRAGSSNPTRANAVAKLATGVVETVRMEMEVSRHLNSATSQVKAIPDGQASPLGQPLALGNV